MCATCGCSAKDHENHHHHHHDHSHTHDHGHEHTHDHDESIWLVAGEIRFGAAGRELVLTPGDRLMLPAGTRHTADAGPDGATYLVGQKL